MMIIADTNILSSFLTVSRVSELLLALKTNRLYIPQAIYQEISTGAAHGRFSHEAWSTSIQSQPFVVVDMTPTQIALAETMPASLAHAERHAIAMALDTKSRLLTNDRRAVSYCRELGILCLNLSNILRLLWQSDVCTKEQVRTIMHQMTALEGIIFKNAEAVFDT